MSTPVNKLATPETQRAQADMGGSAFLTVPQLAQLLHVNEKKIYQLAGLGEIPGTKVTGKWIFPRRLIEDWLLENSHGGVLHDRLLIAGSEDELIHQLCNQAAIDWQQQALVSYSPTGTRHGLRMLDTGRVDACFINWGPSEDNARRHMGLLRNYRNHQSWVIVRCLQRNQGLVSSHAIEASLTRSATKSALVELMNQGNLRWAMRQTDSGSKRLLEDLCAAEGLPLEQLHISALCNSERSAVATVHRGRADICCGSESTASDFGLPFHAISTVSLDLVMTRKSYFRTLVQDFIVRLLDSQAHELAATLGGYILLPNPLLVTID